MNPYIISIIYEAWHLNHLNNCIIYLVNMFVHEYWPNIPGTSLSATWPWTNFASHAVEERVAGRRPPMAQKVRAALRGPREKSQLFGRLKFIYIYIYNIFISISCGIYWIYWWLNGDFWIMRLMIDYSQCGIEWWSYWIYWWFDWVECGLNQI